MRSWSQADRREPSLGQEGVAAIGLLSFVVGSPVVALEVCKRGDHAVVDDDDGGTGADDAMRRAAQICGLVRR